MRILAPKISAEGPRVEDLYVTHLAFLGAHGAAIDGLEPVMLAAGDATTRPIELVLIAPDPRVPELNHRIQFAESPLHDKALAYLAFHPDPALTYTKALEIVARADSYRR